MAISVLQNKLLDSFLVFLTFYKSAIPNGFSDVCCRAGVPPMCRLRFNRLEIGARDRGSRIYGETRMEVRTEAGIGRGR